MTGPISDHIRSNIWAIVACFIAAMGTAVVASASDDGPQATTSGAGAAKKQIKKLKKLVAAQGVRIAALEASRPPTGPAGGELAGSYPNPSVGTVSGLDLASSNSPAGAINFSPDVNLYRDDANLLVTDDSFAASGNITALGNLVVDSAAFVSGSLSSNHVRLFQTSDPGTAMENQVFIYVRNNGGTAELVAEWDNNTDVIAIE
jgi:hypothetical protein